MHTQAAKGAAGQRVRVGLTGLAFVFLLVMLATTFLRGAGGDLAAGNRTTNSQTPTEPLAELGVAPGNAPPASRAPASAPATHAAPTR